MVLIPAGTFTMGDNSRPPGRNAARGFRQRVLHRQGPVTQELYEKVMGVNPSKRKDPRTRSSERNGPMPCASATSARSWMD